MVARDDSFAATIDVHAHAFPPKISRGNALALFPRLCARLEAHHETQ